ncbi:MAG TPA: acetate--CoA ligase family protein [Candidatus Polarisedimenticolia bacterium]|nr:acetate--CoA ligase family protein [Candidatus Polarisedimenticolia bacterium]
MRASAAAPSASARSTSAAPATPDLRALFAPESVAIVGATMRGHMARILRDNMTTMGSTARRYFVNPKYDSLLDEPCYPSLAALPERPDCVLVGLGAGRAAAAVEEAALAGARSVIVPGGGIVEGGEAARQMQLDVERIAREHGLALLGPNCMGFVDFTTSNAVYIGDVNPWQPRGVVAGIAQSGSVTDSFVHAGTRIGFSRIISCGAEVMLDACDYLAYCLDDPETRAVILFLEGLKRPERFLALCDRALELGKPVAVLKVGRSAQAQAASVAHSGSLAGEARVTSAALDAAGVIRCTDLDELLEVAELLAGCERLGRGVGRGRTGVITVSTGEASLIADLAPETGIDLPPIPASVREHLAADLPTLGYVGNPLDPWGAGEPEPTYDAAFEAFAASGAYDVLTLVHDNPYRELQGEIETLTSVSAGLLKATAERPQILPVVISLTSGEISHEGKRIFDAAGGIPYLRGAREAFRAIALRARWEARRDARASADARRAEWPTLAADRTPVGLDDTPRAYEPRLIERRVLSERDSLGLLRDAGLPVVDAVAAADADAAVEAADALGYPVVLKLDVAGLAHKSDVGGVRLDLRTPDAVRAAATELLERGAHLPPSAYEASFIAEGPHAPAGLLVEPMAEPGLELIVGLVRDPQYGPAVLVGLGGILAEAIDDTVLALAPIAHTEALEMLEGLRGSAILDGVRGRPPIDRSAVADMIVTLARLGRERPDIVEIDLNPVIAGPSGAVAVDALVVLEAGEARHA